MKKHVAAVMLMLAMVCCITNAYAQRKMDNLGRGVVATRSGTSQVFISWRLLGTEPADLAFNIYRATPGTDPVKLNTTPLTAGTNWTDATVNATLANSYFVRAIVNNVEQPASAAFTIAANTPVQPYFKVPINNTPGYAVKFIWVGDLDGDGEFDFVFDKQPVDETKVILLEAYKRDGTFLWQMDCGPNSVDKYNIEPGSSTLDIGHGDNFTVYDLNGDGKSEVIVRTANGVKFSNGVTVSDPNNTKQFISVLNGVTGVEITRIPYNNPYLPQGPMNGHMGIAYLDGIHPSIIWEAKNRNPDDSFNEMTTAWDWSNGALVQRWQFLTGNRNCPAGHQVRLMDVNGDGKDDVVPMGFVINSDGNLLYSLGDRDIYHGDRFTVGDLDPSRPGIEMYGIQQGYSATGIMWYYNDAKSGQVLLTQKDPNNRDLGRGMAGDFDPRFAGYEFYTFVDGLYNVSGARTSSVLPGSYPNLRFWWDGDLGSENLDGTKFTKWNYLTNSEGRLHTANGGLTVGPNTPGFYGDILGDWREEVVYENFDHNSLLIYTTPTPTNIRLYTLPHNPGYRNSMTVKGYYQSNMPDYFVGYNMQQPPVPPIQKANKYWLGGSPVWDVTGSNWLADTGSAATNYLPGDTVMFDIRGANADTIQLNTAISAGKLWAMNPRGKNYILAGTGKLTGPMDLLKAQPGSFTLCGNHDYTGPTIISEGTFSISGSLESKVTINGKGELGGTGTLKNGIILQPGLTIDGGRISPGHGSTAGLLGTLTIIGNLDVPGNNNFAFDIVPGSAAINDSVVVNGKLAFTGVNRLIVKFANDSTVPGTYTLMRCTDTLTAVPANFIIDGLAGLPKELLIENNQIKIRILPQRAPGNLIWKGTIDSTWDFAKNNFQFNGTQSAFVTNDTLLFDETAAIKTVQLTETAITSGVTFNAASNYTIIGAGGISGSGGVIKLNADTVKLLSANNSYTGKTMIDSGALVVSTIGSAGEPSSLGAAGTDPANLIIKNASLIVNDFCTTNRGITLAGNSILNVPTANSYAIMVGEITGAGSLTKEGPGALYLVNRNTYTGQTFLKNGRINLRTNNGNEKGLGNGGTITIENATLAMDDIRLNSQAAWNIIVPAGRTASLITDGRCAMLGTLTGGGTLNINLPYVRTDLKGNWSAYTGKLNVSGDFRISNAFGYGNSAMEIITGAAYHVTANAAVAIGELSGMVASSISNAAWTIGAKNTNATFNGRILGNSINKVGTGTWTLTGNNTYTGSTTVTAGKLMVNNIGVRGTGTGTVTVLNGATLGGIGSVRGALIINSGGTIEPGNNAIGTFTDSTSIVFANGATAAMEINRQLQTKDVLKVVGTVTFNGTLSVTRLGSENFVVGDNYKLFEATTYQGNFDSIAPATPGSGLAWKFDSTAGILSVVSGTLPVAISKYTATIETGRVRLNWTALQELNNDYYYIERSGDGITVTYLNTVKGRGNATTTKEYTLYDNAPVKGINYYRLTQFDLDGKRTNLGVVTASFAGKNQQLQVFPNPVSRSFKIQLPTSVSGTIQVTITTLDGKLIDKWKLAAINSGIYNLTPEKKLLPGQYVLKVNAQNFSESIRITAQ